MDKVHTHSRTCPTVQITFRFMLHVIPWKLCRARLAKLGNGSVHLSHHHSSCRLSKLGKSCNKTREALQKRIAKKTFVAKRSVDSRIYQSFQLQCQHRLFGANCTYILSLPKTFSTAFSACCEIFFPTDAVFWAFNHLGIPSFVFICDNFYCSFLRCSSRQCAGGAELCELFQRCACACAVCQMMSLMVHRVMMLSCAHYFPIKFLFCTTIFLPPTSFCLLFALLIFLLHFLMHIYHDNQVLLRVILYINVDRKLPEKQEARVN